MLEFLFGTTTTLGSKELSSPESLVVEVNEEKVEAKPILTLEQAITHLAFLLPRAPSL